MIVSYNRQCCATPLVLGSHCLFPNVPVVSQKLSRSKSLVSKSSMQSNDSSVEDMGPDAKMGVVAYQGVPGAYSELAASQACPGYETLPCEQFDIAFESLSQWAADKAVLPVENSLGGSIHAVYDLLHKYKLHIVGETFVAVDHCLLALPGVEKKDIRKVLSHPQALAQTQEYTRKMGVIRQEYDDTAGAAKMIAECQLKDCAAIASIRASELYGLNVLDRGIQDTKGNITRFVVLSRDPTMALGTQPSDEYKTSIVFSLNEGPGVLFKALSVFALRDISLTKIESRPLRASPLLSADFSDNEAKGSFGFNYLFYIDFIGGLHDENAKNALRNLDEYAKFIRVIGSYPRDLDH
jgi:arogenate/prephenate dehydratase